jgi:hypothetical protein
MENKLECPICGEATSVYMGNSRKDKLCRLHGKMANAGEIIQCEKCLTWHKKDELCTCSEPQKTDKQTDENTHCVICGQESNGKPQCKICYTETKGYMDTLDKNNTVRKLRDYYYNLKERILIMRSIKETKDQCNKLIAIAITQENVNDDSSLIERVYTDVQTLIKGKQPQPTNQFIVEEQKESDERKVKINTAQDGHNVDSDMEVRVDDVLYNAYIFHCYGKNIDEITEKRKKCDWFIPISNGKGIYIEYWGMDKKDYLVDRKEKEELYKKYNIPYIGIEKDDPKKDTQTFRSNLIRDLTKLAIEKFGFMPEWKK